MAEEAQHNEKEENPNGSGSSGLLSRLMPGGRSSDAASSDSEEADTPAEQGLGTFEGVYRPTVLTILGVMMYLREGWIVGEAGLIGGILIILSTFFITGIAALSLSCITTNIHVGAGGVFSIISQSLGLESGGSIGVPLYLGQALSSALYIYGFTEAWLYIFPDHNIILVAYCIFAVGFAATLISTKLAFKLQGVVMIVIIISLMSILLGATNVVQPVELQTPQLWGAFEAGGFWVLFAIFFPAGTGIKVGASMSGALENPRKSIPKGTLAAVGTAIVVYLIMAVWYGMVVPGEELRTNRIAVVDYAAVGEIVLLGILCSTFVASLSAMVAAPRVLQALGEQEIVPKGSFFAKLTESGEPRNAILATGLLIAAALTLGSLDRVAVLITMFFILIYLTINTVVAIETALGMVSFRPTFKLPLWVPVIGAVSCVITLFVISPFFALIALSIIVAIYVYLVQRRLKTPWQTVRSSIFVSLADWASKHIGRTPEEANERSWKPDLLVPVTSRTQIEGSFRFLRVLIEPKGSLKVIGIRSPDKDKLASETTDKADAPKPEDEGVAEASNFEEAASTQKLTYDDGLDTLSSVIQGFQAEELFATSVVLEAPTVLKGVQMSAAVLRGSAFRPNVLYGYAHRYDEETLQGFVDTAAEYRMGLALYYEHPEAGLGQERRVTVWTSDQSPKWELGLRLANLDLSVLLGYQTVRNWQGDLTLATVCREQAEVPNAEDYLQRLIDDARLPRGSRTWVRHGDFGDQIKNAPRADLNILGLPRDVNPEFVRQVVDRTQSSCLFVRDSGLESALA